MNFNMKTIAAVVLGIIAALAVTYLTWTQLAGARAQGLLWFVLGIGVLTQIIGWMLALVASQTKLMVDRWAGAALVVSGVCYLVVGSVAAPWAFALSLLQIPAGLVFFLPKKA